MPNPTYRHKCKTCKYLTTVFVEIYKVDVYLCGESLLVRWGSKAIDHYCAPLEIWPIQTPIRDLELTLPQLEKVWRQIQPVLKKREL